MKQLVLLSLLMIPTITLCPPEKGFPAQTIKENARPSTPMTDEKAEEKKEEHKETAPQELTPGQATRLFIFTEAEKEQMASTSRNAAVTVVDDEKERAPDIVPEMIAYNIVYNHHRNRLMHPTVPLTNAQITAIEGSIVALREDARWFLRHYNAHPRSSSQDRGYIHAFINTIQMFLARRPHIQHAGPQAARRLRLVS